MRIDPEQDFLGKLEYELIEGKARWLAEFNESFRNVSLPQLEFDMVVRGSTRGKSGYLFSAILARTMLPAYAASCFAKILRGGETFGVNELEKYLVALRRYVKDKEAKWAFFVLVHSGRANGLLKEKIQSLNDQEIGVALVNVATMEVSSNPSLIGRSTKRILPKKGKAPGVDTDTNLSNVPDQAQARQWGKLALVFGMSLAGFTVLSFIFSGLLVGVLATTRAGLLINIGLAIAITYWYSKGKYYNKMSLNKYEITLQTGRGKPTSAKWSDFDLVSLMHLGAGQFDVRLYKVGDHDEFLSVPVSGVKVNPSDFRWKAMQLCLHGMNHYVRI